MQLTPAKVVLIAVASSLATAGALELFSAKPRTAPVESLARSPSPSLPPKAAALLDPATSVPLAPDFGGRLRLLEERIDALERPRARQPVSPAADTRNGDDLRALVMDWIAEEREARRLQAELAAEEENRTQRDFDIRVGAKAMAEEHGLSDHERESLVTLRIEVEDRRAELESAVDPRTSDPAEVERSWVDFEEWMKRRAVEELGPGRAAELFGD